MENKIIKLAVISDIHSNINAFKLALEYSKKINVDKYIFLGDYITDGFSDNEVLSLIKKHATFAIRGNREDYIIEIDKGLKPLTFNKNQKPLIYTYKNLKDENLEYIKNLNKVMQFSIHNIKFLIVHGNNPQIKGYKNKQDLDYLIENYNFDICLYGHSHISCYFHYKGKKFINPGSLGLPLDDPHYKYGILEITENNIKYTNIRFSVIDTYNQLYNHYLQSDYYKLNPEWTTLLLKQIQHGRDYIGNFIKKIEEKTNEDSNFKQYNEVWELAYKEIIGLDN